MKKYFFLFLFITTSAFSLDYFGELNGTQRFTDHEGDAYLELKLGSEYRGENYYSQVSILGTKAQEDDVDLYRAYLEWYNDNLTISAGRQMVVWGSAYLFNGADIFNQVDIEDPRSDKPGLDSLRIKYNLNYTSRLETILFKNSSAEENFAARYTFLLGNYEIMANYFKYEREYTGENPVNNQDIVLEIKGDMGVGLWSQLINKDTDVGDQNSMVLGGDYSFDIGGNLLYTLAEGVYIKEEDQAAFYLMYNYSISEDTSFSQRVIFDGKLTSFFLISSLNYRLNDYFDLKISYNYYKNFEKLKLASLGEREFNSEIVFEINGFF